MNPIQQPTSVPGPKTAIPVQKPKKLSPKLYTSFQGDLLIEFYRIARIFDRIQLLAWRNPELGKKVERCRATLLDRLKQTNLIVQNRPPLEYEIELFRLLQFRVPYIRAEVAHTCFGGNREIAAIVQSYAREEEWNGRVGPDGFLLEDESGGERWLAPFENSQSAGVVAELQLSMLLQNISIGSAVTDRQTEPRQSEEEKGQK